MNVHIKLISFALIWFQILNPFGTIYTVFSYEANENNIDFFIILADLIRQSITHKLKNYLVIS